MRGREIGREGEGKEFEGGCGRIRVQTLFIWLTELILTKFWLKSLVKNLGERTAESPRRELMFSKVAP